MPLSTENDISAAPVHPDTTFDQLDNSALAEEDFNDARYVGGRFSLAYEPTDNFSLLVQHTQQSLESDGVFTYDPNLEGQSSTSRYTPEGSEDDFGLTTLTLNGRIGMLDAIYTVGYLNRDMEAMIDYSGYSLGGGYQVYYLCEGVRDWGQASGFEGYGGTVPVTSCYDAQGRYEDETDSERITQEFRVSMPDEHRVRVTAGAFFDEQKTRGTGAFGYIASRLPGDEDGSWPAMGLIVDQRQGSSRAGKLFAPDINFVNDFTRKTEQMALFGQVDFDLTPTVTASFGARWYDIDFDFKGGTNSSFLCKYGSDGCDIDAVAGDRNFNNHVTGRLRALGANTPRP